MKVEEKEATNDHRSEGSDFANNENFFGENENRVKISVQ